MSLFMIETDAVSSAASSITSIASELSNIASTVSGYDTSCEDFDFSSAKSVIANNIQACSTKVTNTATLMNEVVNSHTSLQGSLTFTSSATKAAQAAASAATTTGTPVSDVGGSGTASYSGGGSSGGGGTSYGGGGSSGGGGSYSGGGSSVGGGSTGGGGTSSVGGSNVVEPVAAVEPVAGVVGTAAGVVGGGSVVGQPETEQELTEQPETEQELTEQPETEQELTEQPETEQPGTELPEVEPQEVREVKITNPEVQETPIEDKKVSEEEEKIFADPFFDYDDGGYAVIDDEYVISCTSDVGEIGDKVVITLDDGKKVECVIGEVRDNDGKDIRFFTNDSFDPANKDNITSGMTDKIVKIENFGDAKITVSDKIDKAVLSAVDISTKSSSLATDDSISFIVHAYADSGIPIVKPEGKFDGDIQNLLVKSGFNWIDGEPSPTDLQPGDILITKNNGVMMNVEGGKLIIDYSTFGTKKTDDGKVVPDIDMDDLSIKGILRYDKKKVVSQKNEYKVIYDQDSREDGVKV